MAFIDNCRAVEINGSTLYNIHGDQNNIILSSGAEILRRSSTYSAAYNSAELSNAPKCFPGTRERAVGDIFDWVSNPHGRPVCWISGLARSGKSTIAHTIAKICAENKVLAASFFFARGDVERNSCRHLFPTIAYQLTTSIPSLRVPIYQTLHDDHGILEHGIQDQLQKLIVEPLLDKNFSPCTSARVVIIDAIDECDDQKSAKDIIKFFASALRHELNNLPLQFIITSRPEIHIRAAFRDPCIRSMTHIVNLWDFNSHADIHVFLTSRFEQIYQDHFDIMCEFSPPWPKPRDIEKIVQRSSGLFAFASSVVEFIDSAHDHPDRRLQIVLDGSSSPYGELDRLYKQVLSMTTYAEPLRLVLGTIVLLYRQLSIQDLSRLLRLEIGNIRLHLRRLCAILFIPDDPHQFVVTFRQPLCDFLTDSQRSGIYFIDSGLHHLEIAGQCFRLMIVALHRDICHISDPSRLNNEVTDLQTKCDAYINGALRYACHHWANHLSEASPQGRLQDDLNTFTLKSLLYWIECLSLLGGLHTAIPSLRLAQNWLRKIPDFRTELLQNLHDAECLLSECFDPVAEAALCIYEISMSRDSYFVICNALADPGTLVLGDARSFLNENAKNLSRAIQNSGDFECACLANIIPIFQRFVSYVLVHLKCGELGFLQTFRENVAFWESRDVVSSLTNYRSMNNTLWTILRNCKALPPDIDPELIPKVQQLIRSDIVVICAQLAFTLKDSSQRKHFLTQQGEEAQSLLNLLQTLLDRPDLDKCFKCLFVKVVIELSQRSGQYPECLVLKGVQLQMGEHAVAGGSFADIWKGQIQGQAVAIKVLRVYRHSDVAKLMKKCSHEMAVWRQLLHPNILPLYGVYHLHGDKSRVSLVSPWMENGNIVQYLKQAPDTYRYPLVLDVAQGLEYLHMMEPTIIHGDLKGVNILVTGSHTACLADFGLTEVSDSIQIYDSTLVSGTMRWQAPEFFDNEIGQGHTTASDVYSFACSCYEIFSGNIPFYKIHLGAAVIFRVIRGERPSRPPIDICHSRGLDDDMWGLINSCWKMKPAERLTASEIVNRLQSRSTSSVEERPHHNWDTAFLSRHRSSLDICLFPSVAYVEEVLFHPNAQAPDSRNSSNEPMPEVEEGSEGAFTRTPSLWHQGFGRDKSYKPDLDTHRNRPIKLSHESSETVIPVPWPSDTLAICNALAAFDGGIFMPMNAGTWLSANTEHLIKTTRKFTQDTRGFDCISLAHNIPIFRRFVIFVAVRLKPSGEGLSLLQNFGQNVATWESWDIITSLINYRRMNDTLWGTLRKCKVIQPDIHAKLVEKLQQLIRIDIVAICARLAVILNDSSQRRDLLARQGEEAQSLLNLLQTLLDWSDLDTRFKHLFVNVLIELSRRSGQYAECLVLKGVQQVGQDPVAGGSVGDVWKGQIQGQVVAIKVMKVYQQSDVAQLMKEFSHEIAVWRQLLHPNILPLYGVYHLGGNKSRVCLVSPWMENGNIVQYLKQAPDTYRYPLVLDVAQGLEYLHTMEPAIIHGDLKGVNILITESGRACLTDFSLTEVSGSPLFGQTYNSIDPIGGTLRWQAPELLDSESTDTNDQGHSTLASDIYSFACSCYEVKDLSIGLTTASYLPQIFSDKVPFYEIRHDYKVIPAVTRGRRPSRPPDDICHSRGLDDDMWELINSCWKMKPAERLTASEIVNHLQSRSVLSVEERPHHNWDTAFPSLLRSSLEEIPLFPSDDYVEAALFCHDSMACKILS